MYAAVHHHGNMRKSGRDLVGKWNQIWFSALFAHRVSLFPSLCLICSRKPLPLREFLHERQTYELTWPVQMVSNSPPPPMFPHSILSMQAHSMKIYDSKKWENWNVSTPEKQITIFITVELLPGMLKVPVGRCVFLSISVMLLCESRRHPDLCHCSSVFPLYHYTWKQQMQIVPPHAARPNNLGSHY